MKKEIVVEGMSCAGCANTVKTRFEAIDGVKSVNVDLGNNKVTIESASEVNKDTLITALSDTNYSIVEDE